MNTATDLTATRLLAVLGVHARADLDRLNGRQLTDGLTGLLDGPDATRTQLLAGIATTPPATRTLLTAAVEAAVDYRRQWMSGPASRLDRAQRRDRQLLAALNACT